MRFSFTQYVPAIIAACLFGLAPVRAQSGEKVQSASAVKAAYIYNLLSLSDWPDDKSFKAKKGPAIANICTLGISDTSDLEAVAAAGTRRTEGMLTLKVIQKTSWEDAGRECHIIFIGESQSSNMAQILKDLSDQPVLTVSDIDGFGARGGMVELSIINNTVKISTVNKKAIKRAGMRINPDLLLKVLKVIE